MAGKILISKCLLGINCRYDGTSSLDKTLLKLLKNYKLIAVCPEELGGLRKFRGPFEIKGKTVDLFSGKAKVINREGKDVTRNFIKGAKIVLKIAQEKMIDFAILKSRSPSCGSQLIYDGSFKKKLVKGKGVTSFLLENFGIKVLNEDEFKRIKKSDK
ncbi:MAG: hypothetical protein B6D55_01360 [Candidatus Omnitrophica bacterium 4484_70.2]|nr:MAG: hypothetical protein B6D55_01360 [Candidatus Omnitrophica bacterium 4484_70.2]